jgi:hypothetical protein
MDERRGALAERDGLGRARRQEMPEAPEPSPGRREGLAGDAGQPRQVVLDGNVDGDAVGATARAAGEQPRLVEATPAAEALQPDDSRLRDHGALV